MSTWFTVEKMSAVLRVLSLLIALWSGSQAVQGYQVVVSRPDGVASASGEDAKAIGGNVGLSALLAFVAANKKVIESILTTLGVPATAGRIIGDVIDAGRLNNLRLSFDLAKSEPERQPIRDAARIVVNEIFDEHFPPAEAAK